MTQGVDQITYVNSDLPALDGAAITTSDTVNFSYVARGIYIGVTGDVVIVNQSGSVLTFKNAQQGSILPIRCMRVNATNTTATNLIALF